MLSNSPTIRSLVFCFLAVFSVAPAFAGWNSQVVVGTNAYQGTIALDSAGNATTVWLQTPQNQAWASTALIGQPWSVPVNISGSINAAGPNVHTSAAGKATAFFSDNVNLHTPTYFVDHTAGGAWGTPGSTNGGNLRWPRRKGREIRFSAEALSVKRHSLAAVSVKRQINVGCIHDFSFRAVSGNVAHRRFSVNWTCPSAQSPQLR